MAKKFNKNLLLTLAFLVIFVGASFKNAEGADTEAIETIKKNITDRNTKIEQLNKEIKQLDTQIQQTAKEGQTLKSTITLLDSQRNKLSKELEVTQNQVSATNLSIAELESEIVEGEKKIQTSQSALGGAIRASNQAENFSMVEILLTYEKAADIWNEIEALTRFQTALKGNIGAVRELKKQLAEKKNATEAKKSNLLGLKVTLEDQKKVADINKTEKAKLLSETQNKETAYKLQLEEKKRLSEAFRQELNQYESQLKFIISPTSYPSAGKGILAWPLEDVFITQQFGETEFSKSTNAYNGKGHNGVDFRATTGTKILSAQSGTVEGVGNTDLVPGCFSYGKWVLVRHDNGLSSLYAHLSLIKAVPGQRVANGEVIGYSGNTGFSTGPHLHFGVYASQGVKIVKYENSINCKNAIIPVADIRAYLNPLLYL